MTKEESAAYLGISVRSLQRLTAEGLFRPVTAGPKGVAVYDRAELDAWKALDDEGRKLARASARPAPLVTTRNPVTTSRPLLPPGPPPAPLILPPSELAYKPLLTLAEVCLLLGVGASTVRRMVREGKLKAVKLGRGHKFRPDDLRDFISNL